MDLTHYQTESRKTAIYPGKGNASGLIYATLGLCGESGELAEKIKKMLRDDGGALSLERRQAVIMELSDVLWYAAAIATELNMDLSDVAQRNLDKLNSRKDRGQLKGSGDTR